MISLPIGLVCFIIVIAASAGDVKLMDYFNLHAVIVVVGGTFAILAISTPFKVIAALGRNIGDLFKPRKEVASIRADLMKLAESRTSLKQSKDPLVQYALNLWERGTDQHSFVALMSQYRDQLESEDAEAVSALHNVVKYPPALGMMGTVMGMISLFSNLGTSDKSGLGPALAVAMTATFYGLIMANGLMSPIADRVTVEVIHRKKYFNTVFEILHLIHRREPLSMIEEEFAYREAA